MAKKTQKNAVPKPQLQEGSSPAEPVEQEVVMPSLQERAREVMLDHSLKEVWYSPDGFFFSKKDLALMHMGRGGDQPQYFSLT